MQPMPPFVSRSSRPTPISRSEGAIDFQWGQYNSSPHIVCRTASSQQGSDNMGLQQQQSERQACRSMSLDLGRYVAEELGETTGPASWSDTVELVKRKGIKARKSCSECGTMQTCQWRRGPNGTVSLCNACGIRFRRARNRNRPLAYDEDDEPHADNDVNMREAGPRKSAVVQAQSDAYRDDSGAVVARIVEIPDAAVALEKLARRGKAAEQPAVAGGKKSDIYMLLN
jgi:hypothetical protein